MIHLQSRAANARPQRDNRQKQVSSAEGRSPAHTLLTSAPQVLMRVSLPLRETGATLAVKGNRRSDMHPPLRRMRLGRQPRIAWVAICAMGLVVGGCTRTTVSVTEIARATESSVPPTATAGIEPGPTLRPTEPISSGLAYAIAWVPGGEALVVRQPAGTSGSEVDELSSDQQGIQLTGNSTLLGSSLWVEIFRAGGGTGWVNSWNLTEVMSSFDFCADARAEALVASVTSALRERDGQKLADLVNPRRGLVFRLDWWNPDVPIASSEVSSLLTSPRIIQWGIERENNQPIAGTFRQTVLPALDDVLESDPVVSCNSLNAGRTAQSVQWPDEFTNINFYSFYRPANQPGNELSWRGWAMGIEYVGGRPFLSLLVQYRAEI